MNYCFKIFLMAIINPLNFSYFFKASNGGSGQLKEPEDKRYFWVGSIFSCGFYSLFQFSKVENLSKASKWFFAQRKTFKKWYVNEHFKSEVVRNDKKLLTSIENWSEIGTYSLSYVFNYKNVNYRLLKMLSCHGSTFAKSLLIC